ncbi:MAG: PD-(D/E)XK nuclease family protein [Deltaproteobacteria bacterium]|nr:PD-(D/E)XK nuclease family protein [Deltaproteobacteria bacterium]
MTMINCSVGKGIMSREDCLGCALKGENTCGYDYAVLRWLINDEEKEKRQNEIHVTDVTGCLRRAWYDKCDPTPEGPHENLARALGSVVHKALEGDDDFLMSEMPIKRGELQGTADIVYKNGTILDFKTTRWLSPEKLPYGSHELQVNIYAWMLRGMGQPTNELKIQYVDMSGPTKCRKCRVPVREVLGEIVCPKCLNAPKGAHLGALTVDVPVMSDDHVENIISPRIKTLIQSIADLTPPDPEPSWLCEYCAHREKCNPTFTEE